MSKSKKTHIVCVLDRSGSMRPLEVEVINSFNKFVEDQKEVEGKAELTLVLFDNEYEVVYDAVDIKKVKPLTKEDYFGRGMTALNDAIGKTLETFKKKKNVIFLVQTDGYENASQEFTPELIKETVEAKRKSGWEFIFFGANIDAFSEGNSRGFAQTQNFSPTANGVSGAYASMSKSSTQYRTST